MDKISSILPSSARVTSVDMQDAHPVRPGTPSFGRPVGVSHLRRNLSMSSIDQQLMNTNLTERQRDGLNKAKIVQDISAGFFMKKPAVTPAATFEVSDPAFLEATQDYAETIDAYESFPSLNKTGSDVGEEYEYLAPGSYIDVKV